MMDGPAALRLEDILFEVFSRVGNVKDLFRCAVTCSRWRRLFTDPEFLRRLWPETDRALLLGLFFHGPATKTSTGRGQVFVPRLESPPLCSGDCGLALASSVLIAGSHDHGHHRSNDPLVSRHGILLRHIFVNLSSCCIKRKPEIHYRLLDPITGAHDDVAPPRGCTCVNHANGYAILTAADGDHIINREQRPPSAPHHAFSGELLLVGSHLDKKRLHQHVHSFSGAARRWRAPAQIRHHNRLRMAGERAAVVHRGAAHWLYADDRVDASVPQCRRDLSYLLSASTSTGRASASVTRLAIKTAGGVPYLCVRRDGRLSLARVHSTRVDVWTQQDGDDGGDVVSWLRAQFCGNGWLLTQVIQMPEAAVPAGTNFMCCSWFHLSKGAMVAVYGGSGVFALDLETKAMEKIMDLTWCDRSRGYYSCLPYEMDPAAFFIGQLGGRATETEQQVGLTIGGISSLIFQFIMPDFSLFMRD
jgi:hypothetical protein